MGLLLAARIVSISVDKVIAVDNSSWLSVHIYAMDSWKRVPHLLHLSCVTDCGTTDELTNTIIYSLLEEGGLSCESIASKFVYFQADGVPTFQGPKKGGIVQIPKTWTLFVVSASYTNYCSNLVVKTLANYPMIARLEGLFQSVYFYFCRSHKQHSELQKLADLIETKANKMVRNVDTRWIFIRSPAQRIKSEYNTLFMKMDFAASGGQKATAVCYR